MNKFSQEFIKLDLKDITKESNARKENDWRYVQTLAVKVDDGIDLIYSFMKDGKLENLKVCSVKESDVVPSISEDFLEAFVWENEIHDLWNVNFEGIAIDFKGKFYNVAVDAPMTIVDPEAKERKEKQAKIDAALAAKKAKAKQEANKEGKGE